MEYRLFLRKGLLNLTAYVPDTPSASRVAERIALLRESFLEDEQRDISIESLRFFSRFLAQNPHLRTPNLLLSPQGEIIARWRGLGERLTSIHFLPDGRVRLLQKQQRHDKQSYMDLWK